MTLCTTYSFASTNRPHRYWQWLMVLVNKMLISYRVVLRQAHAASRPCAVSLYYAASSALSAAYIQEWDKWRENGVRPFTRTCFQRQTHASFGSSRAARFQRRLRWYLATRSRAAWPATVQPPTLLRNLPRGYAVLYIELIVCCASVMCTTTCAASHLICFTGCP